MHANTRGVTAITLLAAAVALAGACRQAGDTSDSALGTTQSKGVYDTTATPQTPDSTAGLPGRSGDPGVAGDTLNRGRRPPPR